MFICENVKRPTKGCIIFYVLESCKHIHVSGMDDPASYPEYVLAIHSSKRLLVEQISPPAYVLADAIISLTLAKGQRHEVGGQCPSESTFIVTFNRWLRQPCPIACIFFWSELEELPCNGHLNWTWMWDLKGLVLQVYFHCKALDLGTWLQSGRFRSSEIWYFVTGSVVAYILEVHSAFSFWTAFPWRSGTDPWKWQGIASYPEDFNLMQHCYENLKSFMFTVLSWYRPQISL